MYQPYSHDADRYVSYYTSQAGGDLSGYAGTGAQYGSGLGGIFRGLFRSIFPLVKKGFAIAKPHLKTAGKSILSDVITRAVNPDKQEGSGMVALARRPIKRPPGKKRKLSTSRRSLSVKTRRRASRHKKNHTSTARRRHRRKAKSTHRPVYRPDIF